MAPNIALTMVLLLMAVSRQVVAATHHHVVGYDKGWDTSTDLASWASTRLFKVGDNIWFDNTASQEGLVELESVEEFSSCDLSNPIKMYTEDINKVSLDAQGSRFFVSANPDSCKKGLKIHINVHPHKEEETNGDDQDQDDTPTYKDFTNPRGRYDPDVPEPDPSPKPKPKPPHIAPPPEEFDPDFDPYSPPEPYYPPPTPSASTSLNVERLFAMVAAAFWVAI